MIRWATGMGLASAIVGGSCLLFPALMVDLGALVLTSSLAIIVGLQVALPPLDPEDDWVRIGLGEQEEPERRRAVASIEEEKPRAQPKPAPVGQLNGKPIRLVARERGYGLAPWAIPDDYGIAKQGDRRKAGKQPARQQAAGLAKLLSRN